ncbi:hypothetical protein MKX01_019607 [Papaver californicum]|nr:hypothetical protein MKX01_019607 [Papaver californicum]
MALWAYKTSPRSSTGTSSYSLVYGADAILPADIKIPSARIAAASGVSWDERAKTEKYAKTYRRRISRAYNKTVQPLVFQAGDLVLKTSKHIQQDMSAPKFSPKWEGPYVVSKAMPSGYYKIVNMNGRSVGTVINGKWLKAYYA